MRRRKPSWKAALAGLLLAVPWANRADAVEPSKADDPTIREEIAKLSRGIDTLRTFDEQARALNKLDRAANPLEIKKLKDAAGKAKPALRDIAETAALLFLGRADSPSDSLDSDFEKRSREAGLDPAFLAYVKKEGGANAIMRRIPHAFNGADENIDSITAQLSSGRKVGQGLLDKLIAEPVYAKCTNCHCLFLGGAAIILVFIPGGQPAAIGATGAFLACAAAPAR